MKLERYQLTNNGQMMDTYLHVMFIHECILGEFLTRDKDGYFVVKESEEVAVSLDTLEDNLIWFSKRHREGIWTLLVSDAGTPLMFRLHNGQLFTNYDSPKFGVRNCQS